MAEVNNTTLNFSPVRMKASSEAAAVEQALIVVGATRDQVDVEVLDEDAKGVTVRVSPRRAETAAETAPAAENTSAAEPEVTQQSTLAEAPTSVYDESVDDSAVLPESEQLQSEAASTGVESTLEAEEAVPASDEVVAETVSAPITARVVDAAVQERVFNAAQEMLERMGMEARAELVSGPFSEIEASEDDGSARVYLKIEGNDVGILIGKHGQTLQAFQYLLNLTLNNRGAEESDNEDALRVVVDAGGYRTRRAVALQQSAQDAASRAKRDRRSIRLEPMPAHERRLVHMILRDDTAITTGSEGREPLRHVVVSPAGMRPTSGERSNGNRGGYNRGGYGSQGNRGGYNRGGYGSQGNRGGGGFRGGR
jgi:spoIIIJ-associated protein